ncbi:hypothetical protein [Streptomyces sp. NPDC059378]|uniref:hypothetical protein n=1 Tax=Streptomyces sp. NPDC059378 TaxID=3346815 RepID=UPI003692D327
MSGRRSGRLSVAGLIAWRPGSRTRLCHRLLTHPAGKGMRRSMSERDYIALLDGVHQLVKAPTDLRERAHDLGRPARQGGKGWAAVLTPGGQPWRRRKCVPAGVPALGYAEAGAPAARTRDAAASTAA